MYNDLDGKAGLPLQDITMPDVGESVTKGLLTKWLKRPGETVFVDEPLVEIVTDKVNVEVPSECDGILEEILVAEGETVLVGTVIARVRELTTDAGHSA